VIFRAPLGRTLWQLTHLRPNRGVWEQYFPGGYLFSQRAEINYASRKSDPRPAARAGVVILFWHPEINHACSKNGFYASWSPAHGCAVIAARGIALGVLAGVLMGNVFFLKGFVGLVRLSWTTGEVDAWRYYSGVYSGGTANREFGEFDAGVFTLAAVGYDFGEALAVKEALLMGNYVYQQEDPGNTFTRQLEHVGSVNFKFEAERWGVRGDLSYASGYLGQGDLFGLMAMPFVNLTDKLQVIARYTLITSDLPNGVRLANYERRVVPRRGDRYREGYLGLNYFFYGHKLKLQSGLQFADLRDRANDGGEYVGVSWTNGLRVSW